MGSVEIREQAGAAGGVGAAGHTGASQPGEEWGLCSKAVIAAGAVLSPWDVWQCLGTFLAPQLGYREYC